MSYSSAASRHVRHGGPAGGNWLCIDRAGGDLPISFTVIKAGLVVGGQGGTGTLRCANRTYPISIGGLSYGFMIGASETRFRGTATFNGSPRSVAGVYGAGGAGAAIGRGAQAIVLANQNGAVLALTGYQRGLQINADLSGLALTMR